MKFPWTREGPSTHEVAIETIEKLAERLRTSTLLEDKRSAVTGLKGYAKSYQLEVGTRAMDPLVGLLRDRELHDLELVSNALSTLALVCRPREFDEDGWAESVGAEFTEIFAKNNDHIRVVLDQLDRSNFQVGYNVVELLLCLITNHPSMVRKCVLACPLGIPRLVQLLDEQEILQDRVLVLLSELAKESHEIQKLIVFEGALEKIFTMIQNKGCFDQITDHLTLIQSLLQSNALNQNYFREADLVGKLGRLVSNPTDPITEKFVQNVSLVIDILRLLVAPGNPNTCSNQNIFRECGLISRLSSMSVHGELAEKCFLALGDTIRSNLENQTAFAMAKLDLGPPAYTIPTICHVAFDRHWPVSARNAAVYAFESHVVNNPEGQIAIASTWIAPPQNSELPLLNLPAGYLVMNTFFDDGLLVKDSLKHALSSVLLSLILHANDQTKVLALKYSDDEMTLAGHVIKLLVCVADGEYHGIESLGICVLVITWLEQCPPAVHHFLERTVFLQSLIGLIQQDSSSHKGLWSFIYGLLIRFNDNQLEEFSARKLVEIYQTRIGEGIFVADMARVREFMYTKPAEHDGLAGLFLFRRTLEANYDLVKDVLKPGPIAEQFTSTVNRVAELEQELQSLREQMLHHKAANEQLLEKIQVLERDHNDLLSYLAEVEQARLDSQMSKDAGQTL